MGRYRVHRVWIIVEYRPYERKRRYRASIPGIWRRRLGRAKLLAGGAFRVAARMLVAAGVTYLYAIWAIEQAYLQRGYKAYGGEYLDIPFIFLAMLKVALLVEWLWHAAKQWVSQRRERVCRKRSILDTVHPWE